MRKNIWFLWWPWKIKISSNKLETAAVMKVLPKGLTCALYLVFPFFTSNKYHLEISKSKQCIKCNIMNASLKTRKCYEMMRMTWLGYDLTHLQVVLVSSWMNSNFDYELTRNHGHQLSSTHLMSIKYYFLIYSNQENAFCINIIFAWL